jgi:hypothetical protein
VHEIKSKKLGWILLKLDFEKAYDRVNSDFLTEVLRWKYFDPGVVHRISQLVSSGQTSISINKEIGTSFRNKRGVRQGIWSPRCFSTSWLRLSSIILCSANLAGHTLRVGPAYDHWEYYSPPICRRYAHHVGRSLWCWILVLSSNPNTTRFHFFKNCATCCSMFQNMEPSVVLLFGLLIIFSPSN